MGIRLAGARFWTAGRALMAAGMLLVIVTNIASSAGGSTTLPTDFKASITPQTATAGNLTAFGITLSNTSPQSTDTINQFTVTVPANYTAITSSSQNGWSESQSTDKHTVTFTSPPLSPLAPGQSPLTFNITATPTTATTSIWGAAASGTVSGLLNQGFNADSSNSANMTVHIIPGAPTKVIVGAPASSTAGSAFTTTATLKDVEGNTTTNAAGSVSLRYTGPSSGSLGSQPVANGVATFNVPANTLTKAGSYTLTATFGTISGTATTSIVPDVPKTIVVATPTQATAATPFTVTATLNDQFGNLATNYTGSVSLAFASGSPPNPSSTPSLPASATPSNGVATWTLSINTAATGYALTATAGSASGTSSAFSVVPGVPATIVVSAPGKVQINTNFTVSATLYDAEGNIATNATNPVTFAYASNSPTSPSTPTLPASVTPSNGVAFLTLSIANINSSGYIIQATSGSASGTSGQITTYQDVTACPPNTNPYNCTTPPVGNPNNTTLQVNTFGSGSEVITVNVGGTVQAPPCVNGNADGQPASYFNQNSSRTVTLTLTVQARETEKKFAICYEASHSFTTSSGLPATSIGANNSGPFYGILPNCSATIPANTAPCVTSITPNDTDGIPESAENDDSTGAIVAVIHGTSGDPIPQLVHPPL